MRVMKKLASHCLTSNGLRGFCQGTGRLSRSGGLITRIRIESQSKNTTLRIARDWFPVGNVERRQASYERNPGSIGDLRVLGGTARHAASVGCTEWRVQEFRGKRLDACQAVKSKLTEPPWMRGWRPCPLPKAKRNDGMLNPNRFADSGDSRPRLAGRSLRF